MTLEDIDQSGILPLPVDQIIRSGRRRYDLNLLKFQNLNNATIETCQSGDLMVLAPTCLK